MCAFAIFYFTCCFVLLVNVQTVYYAYAYEIFPACGSFNNMTNIWLWFGYVLICFNIQKYCFVSSYNFETWFIQIDTKISRTSSGVYHANCKRLQSTIWLISVSKGVETLALLLFASSDLISSFLVFHRRWIDESMFPFFFILFSQPSNQRWLFILCFLYFHLCSISNPAVLHCSCWVSICMHVLLYCKKATWKKYLSGHCEHQAPTAIQNKQNTFHISGFPLF